MAGSGDESMVVRLDGVPVRLFLESQDHQHELIRELQLIEIGDRLDVPATERSHRLARMIAEILSQYQAVRSATRDQALAALERGDDVVTLDVPVYPGMAAALREWLALLEEADELCRAGELLLLACGSEVRDLRRWYVRELCTRIDAAVAHPA